jgi:tetratricopeptide (TPR) repeat protein
MKCEHCGAENNFDWATFCKNCQQPLQTRLHDNIAIDSQSNHPLESDPATAAQKAISDDNDKIEIGVSDPMDYIMGSSSIKSRSDFSARETIEPDPEPVDSEMTLYRDQDVKLSIAESGSNPKVMVETLKNNMKIIAETNKIQSSEEVVDLQTPEEAVIENSTAIDDEPQAEPVVEKISDPEPVKKPEIEDKAKIKNEFSQPQATEPTSVPVRHEVHEQHEPRPEARLIESPLSEIKSSRGVIYYTGKHLKVTGGIKVSLGDEININGKVFDVKRAPSRSPLLYIGISAAAAIIFFVGLLLMNGSSKEIGQLVGTINNGITCQPLSRQAVKIVELHRTVTTSQAGFFIFDDVPAGIYTVQAQTSDGSKMEDRITVLKGQISTVALRETQDKPQPIITEPAPVNTEPVEAAKPVDDIKTGKGLLKLSLSPTTAAAYIDGKPMGVGSNSYKINPGSYTLTVKKAGYEGTSQTIVIDPDKTLSLKIALSEENQAAALNKSSGEMAYESEIAGNFANAMKYYEDALSKDPRDVGALLGKARCAKESGLADNALACFMQAAKLAGDKGDVTSQIAALTGVIELKPNTFTAYSSRGELYYGIGKYDQAVDDFSKVIEMDNRNLGAYYKLGNCFYKTQNYQDALKAYLAAQELNFADPKAEACLAKTYLAMGDKKNLKKSYEKFKDLASYSTRLEYKKDPEWQKVLASLGEKE